MVSFKDWFRERLQLTESPMRIGMMYGEWLDSAGFNTEEAQRVIEECPLVNQLSADHLTFNLHSEEMADSKIMHYWLTPQPSVACYNIHKHLDTGIVFTGVWNDIKFKALARYLAFNYYLKQHKFIQSDVSHTPQGEAYWKKLITQADQLRHRTTVITIKNNEVDIDNVERYWGYGSEFANYQIRIYALE